VARLPTSPVPLTSVFDNSAAAGDTQQKVKGEDANGVAMPRTAEMSVIRVPAIVAFNVSWSTKGTFSEHSRNIRGTFSEDSGKIRGTFSEHSRNIQ
jgi:hypothetical protein